ncbi:MAG: hypothetical protein MRK01_11085 [Candidatus Scalindua sp.]|nr:hypothetical protein [Candidatus Scalindua sp.]
MNKRSEKTMNLFYRVTMHSKQAKESPFRVKIEFKRQIENAVESMSGDYVKITFAPY